MRSTTARTRSTSARRDESRAVIDAIRPFFGEDPLILTRGTRVLLRGKYYVYPLEMLQVLTGVSPLLSARIMLRLRASRPSSRRCRRPRHGAFVRGMGRPEPRAARSTTCASGSTRSASGACRPSQISSKQAQRVAKLNLKNIILRTLGIKADPATYFTKYMYPRQGISVLFENMAAKCARRGNDIRLDSPVVRLERDGRAHRRASSTRCNGREETR